MKELLNLLDDAATMARDLGNLSLRDEILRTYYKAESEYLAEVEWHRVTDLEDNRDNNLFDRENDR